MYQSYEFTFAGQSSRMFGMMVCDFGDKKHGDNPFGNRAKVVETRLANRVKPIHYGVRYHDEPLSFTLIFGAEQELDRYDLQEVARWLTGYQEYQWLTIEQPDLENVRFRCLIESLTPVSVGWFPVAFEARVICDCPYAYGYECSKTLDGSGSEGISIYNDGTARVPCMPTIRISVRSGTEISLENTTTGKKMTFTGLPAGGASFTVNCEDRIITDDSGELDLYNHFNYVFPALEAGENRLKVTGDAAVTVSCTFLYNVGA